METQNFDLSKPLALRYDKVAYLVDEKNVDLYHQYPAAPPRMSAWIEILFV